MKRSMMKSKIHRATVTGADLNYEGSISISPALLDAAQLLPYERVEIYNVSNGMRFSTYAIPGKDREISLNGAAARLVQKGDLVIIVSYGEFEDAEIRQFNPRKVFVNAMNDIVEIQGS